MKEHRWIVPSSNADLYKPQKWKQAWSEWLTENLWAFPGESESCWLGDGRLEPGPADTVMDRTCRRQLWVHFASLTMPGEEMLVPSPSRQKSEVAHQMWPLYGSYYGSTIALLEGEEHRWKLWQLSRDLFGNLHFTPPTQPIGLQHCFKVFRRESLSPVERQQWR